MKTVIYSSTQKLNCECDTDVILCVSEDLTASGAPVIEATLLSSEASGVGYCGKQAYKYYIEYNEGLLKDPTIPLYSINILGVICRGCLTNYIDYKWETGPVGPQGPQGDAGLSCTDIGAWLDWTPTVDSLPVAGQFSNITPLCRYAVTPNGAYVTIIGEIRVTIGVVGCTGLTITGLPLNPSPLRAVGNAATYVGPSGVRYPGTFWVSDFGGSPGAESNTSFGWSMQSLQTWSILFSLVYEAEIV